MYRSPCIKDRRQPHAHTALLSRSWRGTWRDPGVCWCASEFNIAEVILLSPQDLDQVNSTVFCSRKFVMSPAESWSPKVKSTSPPCHGIIFLQTKNLCHYHVFFFLTYGVWRWFASWYTNHRVAGLNLAQDPNHPQFVASSIFQWYCFPDTPLMVLGASVVSTFILKWAIFMLTCRSPCSVKTVLFLNCYCAYYFW
jgi:hypothetical protein